VDPRAKEVLEFWFGDSDLRADVVRRKVWFVKDPRFDEEIRSRFFATCEDAARGAFTPWLQDARECLALIILLDQFPRNLFRGEPRAFATDPDALASAQHAVERGFDQFVAPGARMFFYLPFEHSEDIAMQRRAVALFEAMREIPEMSEAIRYAQLHFDVIRRFGRFPHRNAILGRISTPDEEAFLRTPGSSF
jgi:uncharacterized protein (DUF924 family)